MNTRLVNRRKAAQKRKASFGEGGFNTFINSEQGAGAMGAAAGGIGMIGDSIQGANGGTSMVGGALSGAGKGASMGMALGPWGAAAGAVIGGASGLIKAGKEQEAQAKAEEAQNLAIENQAIQTSAAQLQNYDSRGIGKGSTFEKGGLSLYPFKTKKGITSFQPTQYLEEGGITEAELQPIAGGNAIPISEDAIQFSGYNPNAVDAIELESAMVNDSETAKPIYNEGGELEASMIFSQDIIDPETGLTFADAHKKLEKSKVTTGNPRFEAFNAFIDKKTERKFAFQQEINGDSQGENPEEANAGGMPMAEANIMGDMGKTAFQGGGDLKGPILRNVEEVKQKDIYEYTNPQEWLQKEEDRKEGFSVDRDQYQQEENNRIYGLSEQEYQYEDPQRKKLRFDVPDTKPTPGKDDWVSNEGAGNSWYNNAMGTKVGGLNLREAALEAHKKTGVDPQVYATAMIQEGWNQGENKGGITASGIAETYKFNEGKGVNAYGPLGLDTVGEYQDQIQQKLGGEYAPATYDYELGENELNQSIQTANFKDPQRMFNTSAALYSIRGEEVDRTIEKAGYNVSPHARQALGYLGYHTQEQNPNARVNPNTDQKRGRARKSNESVSKTLENWKKKGYLDMSEANFKKALEKDSSKSPHQQNTWDFYRRLDETKGYFSKKGERPSQKLDKEPLKSGGYTDMNTLSAEHMKANLTKRKKGKKSYQNAGFMEAASGTYDARSADPYKFELPDINALEVGRKKRVASAQGDKQGFNFDKLGDTIGTYGSDVANMFTRPPEAIMGTPISRVNYQRDNNKAELYDIDSQGRALDKSIEQNTAQAGAAASSRGNVLAKTLGARNKSYDSLDRRNQAIQNQEIAANSQIEKFNAGTIDKFNQDTINRKIADQGNISTSLANMSTKFIEGKNQEGLAQTDRDKFEMMGKWYQDSGVGGRAYENDVNNKYKNEDKSVGKNGMLMKRRKRKMEKPMMSGGKKRHMKMMKA